MDAYHKRKIRKIGGSSSEEAEDLIAVEKRVRISVNGRYLISLYCTPHMVREFVVGVVFNEGLISGGWCAEHMSIEYGDEISVDIPAEGKVSDGERVVTSGCAGGISIASKLPEDRIIDGSRFESGSVRDLFREFQKRSDLYRLTGGVHSAALSDGHSVVAFAEDIGRHNAVDKVIGYCLLEQISFKGSIMLASGRLSSEIVSKCARCGIPVVVSRAAPTSLAVTIAEAAGVTIVGFLRGERMNVYSCSERIVTQ